MTRAFTWLFAGLATVPVILGAVAAASGRWDSFAVPGLLLPAALWIIAWASLSQYLAEKRRRQMETRASERGRE